MLRDAIEELIASGMTEREIADAVKSTQPTINRIRTGATVNPKFALGDALQRLHASRAAAVFIVSERKAA